MRRRGYIAVEGPIGSQDEPRAGARARVGRALMLEDADNNPFLPRFYQDPDKYAFPAQLYFLLTRHNQQRELKQQDLFTQATVADYLFAKDKIFAAMNLAPDELKLYDNVYKLLDAEMARPDLVSTCARLSKCSPSACANAIAISNATSASTTSSACRPPTAISSSTTTRAPLLVVDTSDIDFRRQLRRPRRPDPRNRSRRPRHPILRPRKT